MDIQYLIDAALEIASEGRDSLEYEIDETTQLIEDGEDVETNTKYLALLIDALRNYKED